MTKNAKTTKTVLNPQWLLAAWILDEARATKIGCISRIEANRDLVTCRAGTFSATELDAAGRPEKKDAARNCPKYIPASQLAKNSYSRYFYGNQ